MTDENDIDEETFDTMMDPFSVVTPEAVMMFIRGPLDPEPRTNSFVGRCRICGHVERWVPCHAIGCALTWHVFEQHPQFWRELFGTKFPVDPRPELVGTRVVVNLETGEL